MNRLLVTFKYTSRWENLYCVANVAHRWLRRISSILRIQNLYVYITSTDLISILLQEMLFYPLCHDCGAWVVSSDP